MLAIGVCFVILLSEHVIFQDHAYDQATQGRPRGGIRRLAKKGVDAAPVIAEIEKLDDRRKAIQHELDECLATQNQAAKQIGALMGQGRRDEAEAKKAEVASLKERSNALNAEFKEVSDALQAAIVTLPNFPGRHRARRQNGGRQSGCETGRKLYAIARKPAAPLGAGPQIRHHRLRPGRKAHRRGVPRL